MTFAYNEIVYFIILILTFQSILMKNDKDIITFGTRGRVVSKTAKNS